MAKEFKEWDKKLARHKGELALSDEQRLQADRIPCWPFPLKSWTAAEIKYSVYEAPFTLDWQRFRVGIKGLPTPHKLFKLHQRYRSFVEQEWDEMLAKIERCRIDNYILALKRAGALNDKLEVVK